MTIPYSSALTSFKDAIYPIILWLEESGKASKTVYTDGESYATIGAGFLMSKENLPENPRQHGARTDSLTDQRSHRQVL
ncbi:MAG: hypothetical protein IPG34_10780 [Rhodocyclaceae bacterium]|nr:hypothetical protein [Rhodocyclaceae bacterium]